MMPANPGPGREIVRIASLARRAYEGEAWHGPSLRENLAGVSAHTAASHPIAGAHSIWEIVLHLTAWIGHAAEVLKGATYVSLAGSDDWPPVEEASDSAWQRALANLENAERRLEQAVRDFPVSRLDDHVPQKEFSFYFLVHGVIQHNLYHAGQIGLLKKMSSPSDRD